MVRVVIPVVVRVVGRAVVQAVAGGAVRVVRVARGPGRAVRRSGAHLEVLMPPALRTAVAQPKTAWWAVVISGKWQCAQRQVAVQGLAARGGGVFTFLRL